MSNFKDYKTTFENALGAKRYIAFSLTSTVASTGSGALIWYTGVAPGLLALFVTLLFGFAFLSAYFGYHFLIYADSTRRRLTLITDLENCLDELAIYLERGNANIFNDTIQRPEQVGIWITRSQEWQEEVERYLLENFGLRERNTFKHIVLLEYKITQGINPEHIKHRNILAWKLLAIKDIILRYSTIAAKWRNLTV